MPPGPGTSVPWWDHTNVAQTILPHESLPANASTRREVLESGACALERATHDATNIFIELVVLVVVIRVCPMITIVLGDGRGVCLTYVRIQVQR